MKQRRTFGPLAKLLTACLIASYCHQAFAIGPDTYGYTAATTTFSFESALGGTPILADQDDTGVTIPIGFSFLFYGVAYTTVSFTPNGLVTFGGVDSDFQNDNLTTTAPDANRPSIGVFWHDWTYLFAGSDQAYYTTLGAVGSRRLIIQWNQAESATGVNNPQNQDTVTFQVKLFEGTNNIEFHYQDATVSDDAGVSNGLQATVGIRDTNGHTNGRNLQWSYNQAVISNGLAIRYTHPLGRITKITRLANGTTIRLEGLSAPNQVNRIEAAPNLGNPSPFSNLISVTANASGVFLHDDTSPGTRRFYRIIAP